MPPREYLQAREEAQTKKDDESFCRIIDGAPYFPNLVVPSTIAEDRNQSIKKVVEFLILNTTNAETKERVNTLDSSSWKVAPVTGGNTNELFCVSGMSNSSSEKCKFEYPNDSILIRIFGADGMIDRDEETSTYSSLANQELAVKYYGRFGNGRIEEMLVGWTTLTEDDLVGRLATPPVIQKGIPPNNLNESIARELARLHATFKLPSHFFTDEKLPEPTLWTQLYPWLERALETKYLTDHDTHRANYKLNPPLATLKEELDWLKTTVVGENNAEIGFCHNDLLASNLMMKTNCENGMDAPLILEDLRFVDFEYGGINYFAYDIANHFNEYAGGTAVEDNSTPDYSRCPSETDQQLFLEAYADEYNLCKGKSGSTNAKISAEELGAMVDGFSLANHLVWGLWGVLQAATEGCEDGLDYLNYAMCRFDRYRHDKNKKFSN